MEHASDAARAGERARYPFDFSTLSWRTVDGGRSWQQVGPPGTATLDFRDIEAFDARTAVALTIGEGEDSRIYRTTDGGRTWTESFRNTDPNAFYDCMAFFDRRHGLALSPAEVRERFVAAYRKAGGRVDLHLFEGMSQAFISEQPTAPASLEAIDKIIDFVHRELK